MGYGHNWKRKYGGIGGYIMQLVTHQNFLDEKGKVYCKKQHKVMKLNPKCCSDCEHCVGSLQGEGVECRWKDDYEFPIVSVKNPKEELLRVSKLIHNKSTPEEKTSIFTRSVSEMARENAIKYKDVKAEENPNEIGFPDDITDEELRELTRTGRQ